MEDPKLLPDGKMMLRFDKIVPICVTYASFAYCCLSSLKEYVSFCVQKVLLLIPMSQMPLPRNFVDLNGHLGYAWSLIHVSLLNTGSEIPFCLFGWIDTNVNARSGLLKKVTMWTSLWDNICRAASWSLSTIALGVITVFLSMIVQTLVLNKSWSFLDLMIRFITEISYK